MQYSLAQQWQFHSPAVSFFCKIFPLDIPPLSTKSWVMEMQLCS